MIALDTNVVVRVLTGDDPEQLQTALEVMRSPRLWLAKTVLLETEWVLRYSYGLDRIRVHEALRKLLGLANVLVEDASAVVQALADFASGLDFADALHLYSAGEARQFATFDRKLAKKGASGGPEIWLLNGPGDPDAAGPGPS